MLISDVKLLTPEVLTAILQQRNYLWERGNVAAVNLRNSQTTAHGTVYQLALRYRDVRNIQTAPTLVTLTITRPGWQAAEREVRFYERIAPQMLKVHNEDAVGVVRCYDTFYDSERHQAHFLMNDLTGTHHAARAGQPPTKMHREKMVDVLARIQAFWWEHDSLDELAPSHTDESLDALLTDYRDRYESFMSRMSNRLTARQREMLDIIMRDFPPRRREAMLSGSRQTIVHRQPEPEHFRYAHNSVRLLNWTAWERDSITDDLAYLVACNFPDTVRKFEQKNLLERYYNVLLRSGIEQYTWETFMNDYRASIARCVMLLIAAWSPNTVQESWRTQLTDGLSTLDDLDGMTIYQV